MRLSPTIKRSGVELYAGDVTDHREAAVANLALESASAGRHFQPMALTVLPCPDHECALLEAGECGACDRYVTWASQRAREAAMRRPFHPWEVIP